MLEQVGSGSNNQSMLMAPNLRSCFAQWHNSDFSSRTVCVEKTPLRASRCPICADMCPGFVSIAFTTVLA